MGKHSSTRVAEERKSRDLLAITRQGTNRSGEGERTEELLYDPGSGLRPRGGREKNKGEDNKWDGRKKKKKGKKKKYSGMKSLYGVY